MGCTAARIRDRSSIPELSVRGTDPSGGRKDMKCSGGGPVPSRDRSRAAEARCPVSDQGSHRPSIRLAKAGAGRNIPGRPAKSRSAHRDGAPRAKIAVAKRDSKYSSSAKLSIDSRRAVRALTPPGPGERCRSLGRRAPHSASDIESRREPHRRSGRPRTARAGSGPIRRRRPPVRCCAPGSPRGS